MKKRMLVLCAVIFLWVSGIAMADDEIYKSEFGEVQIKEQKDGSLLFSVSVTVPQLNGFNCTGGLEGTAKKISGNEYLYQDKEGCNLKIIYINYDIALSESGCTFYHGAGCGFEDFYRKAEKNADREHTAQENPVPEAEKGGATGILDEAIRKFKPGMAEADIIKQYSGTKACSGDKICDERNYFIAGEEWMLVYLLDDDDKMSRMVFSTVFNPDIFKKTLDYLKENQFSPVLIVDDKGKGTDLVKNRSNRDIFKKFLSKKHPFATVLHRGEITGKNYNDFFAKVKPDDLQIILSVEDEEDDGNLSINIVLLRPVKLNFTE